jgi:hypothetical protein
VQRVTLGILVQGHINLFFLIVAQA